MANAIPLRVFDYNGTARSGKGTIVKYLASHYEGIASEETGQDYRMITRVLIDSGRLSPAMAVELATATIEAAGSASLAAIVSQRPQLIAAGGEDRLYADDVNALVAAAGRAPAARQAVKAGLRQRIKAVAQSGRYQALLLDGRNLSAAVADLPEITVHLRTFVICTLDEATRRECLRQGVAPGSPEAIAIAASLKARGDEDAHRQHDAVRPDADAIDFWQPPERGGLSLATYAVKAKRQVLFDTTPFRGEADSKVAMLAAAEQMFLDALNAPAS